MTWLILFLSKDQQGKTIKMTCAPSNDLDQAKHLHSLNSLNSVLKKAFSVVSIELLGNTRGNTGQEGDLSLG